MEAFRSFFTAQGYREEHRSALVSAHDPSIRFTNSAISTFKPTLFDGVSQGDRFLLQPALRLQTLKLWIEHRAVSRYGGYFIALGTLSTRRSLGDAHRDAVGFFRGALGVAGERLLFRVSATDEDFISAVRSAGGALRIDGTPPDAFRHHYGLPGVLGRNSNIGIRDGTGFADVGNVISIERADGTRLGIEICCSVNSVLAQLHGISRPLLASPASAAYVAGQSSLMLADSLGSSVALVREGLRPRARGRAGNLKSMLRVVIERQQACALDDKSLLALVSRVAAEDGAIYEHASPPGAACALPLEPAAITARMAGYLDQARGAVPP